MNKPTRRERAAFRRKYEPEYLYRVTYLGNFIPENSAPVDRKLAWAIRGQHNWKYQGKLKVKKV